MKSITSFLITIFLITSFTACAPSTIITGSWLNKSGFEGKEFKSIFIAAMTSNMSVKSALEGGICKRSCRQEFKKHQKH